MHYSIIPSLQYSSLLYSRARSLQTRIEKVAQGVAEKINSEHGDEDAKTGKERQPPRGADIDARVGEHGAPGGNLGWNPDTQKAETGFGDDCRCHGKGADDQGRLDHVWQDMTQNDLRVTRSQTARSNYEFTRAQTQCLTPDHTTIRNPTLHHQGQNQVEKALTEKRHNRDAEQQGRKSPYDLDQLLDREVGFAAEIARNRSQTYADESGDKDHGKRHQKRNAGAIYYPAENIAPQVVRSQDVKRADAFRWFCHCGQFLLVRVVGGDGRTQDADYDES